MERQGRTGGKAPEIYQNLIRVVGWDGMMNLCREYGGEVLYIPKLDRLNATQQREEIRAAWNGRNTAELARKYGRSTRWIQRMVEGVSLADRE